jgi:predicted dehydrogenase
MEELPMSTLSRRHFLGASAAAMAAATLGNRTVLGANDRIRVGVVGCRNRGPQVAEAMRKTGRYEIATLCDCDTAMIDQAAAKLGGTPGREQDFRRMLEDPGIDVVVNATPDHWHGAMTVLALDAGKHVYVEKPASYNLGDGQRMLAAHTKHPKLVAGVGTQQRSGPHFIEARDFLRGGGLGQVAFARAWITQDRGRLAAVPDAPPPGTLDYDMWVGPAPFRPYNPNRCHYEWHWARDYGTGEMGNWGAHWLDIALWFLDLGRPQAVLGSGGMYVLNDIKEWPDTQTVIYQYPKLSLLWEQRIWTKTKIHDQGSGCEFVGDKGSMVISRGGWTFTPRDGRPERHPGTEQEIAHAANFADAIAGAAPLAASLEAGCLSASLCHYGNLAVLHNARLEIDPATGEITNHDAARAECHRAWRAPWDAA